MTMGSDGSSAGARPRQGDPEATGKERALLCELRPRMDALLDRHLAAAREWFPHKFVPWGRGRDYEDGEVWDPDEFALPDTVRSALVVNLLTEDNLPYYFATINRVFAHEAWRVWVRRWTAEEMRHATVIRDYLMVTRAVDPVALERARMVQVAGGETPQPPTVADGFVYLCLQELATRIAHRNTGKVIPDPAGYRLMARVAADENLHYLFYRDLAAEALGVDPSMMMLAIDRQVREFEMPGTGIPGFSGHAMAIARAGIYDLELFHDQILVPVVLNHWAVADVGGLSPAAEEARARVLAHIERVGSIARRQAERKAGRTAGRTAGGEMEPAAVRS